MYRNPTFSLLLFVRQLRRRHTHPQLSLPLPRLQLQCLHRITQPLLLRLQLLILHLLHRRHSPPTYRLPRCRSRLFRRAKRTQTAIIQITLCNERLLAALELVEVVLDAVEEGFYFWADFGEDVVLGLLDVGFGGEFKVLD